MTTTPRLLESDAYPFEFISKVGEREIWRKDAGLVPFLGDRGVFGRDRVGKARQAVHAVGAADRVARLVLDGGVPAVALMDRAGPGGAGVLRRCHRGSRPLPFATRGIYLSCGDSSVSRLPTGSMDLVITDPPFFDTVQYSELADYFYAWAQIGSGSDPTSTRSDAEVQDTDADSFADKLQAVFRECARVLKDDGLLTFTYHHSRGESWHSLAQAVLGADFVVVNSQPVKAEMSVATPVSAAKDPIACDIVPVCRRAATTHVARTKQRAVLAGRRQLARLTASGFKPSRGDRMVVEFGQLLTMVASTEDALDLADNSDMVIEELEAAASA